LHSKDTVLVGAKTTSIDTSALIEMYSTTAGFLPPRLTTTQRDAISSPAEGLFIYNDTTNAFNFYNGSSWGAVGAGGGATAALDNLSGVAINTSLISDTDATDDLGSSSIAWLRAYVNQIHTNVSTKSASYTILDNDGISLILVDDTSSDRTITLPTLADNQGRIIRVMDISTDSGKVTLDGEGAETINGETDKSTYTKNDYIEVQAASTEWKVLNIKQTIYVDAAGNSAAAITANTEAIDFTEITDTADAWSDTGSGNGADTFTAPEDGDYFFNGVVRWANGSLSPSIAAFVDTGSGYVNYRGISANPSSTYENLISAILTLNKGDKVEIRTSTTQTLGNLTSRHWLIIKNL
jgi:hypothetical protein